MSRTLEMIKAVRKAKKVLKKFCPACQGKLLTSQRMIDAKRPENLSDSNDAILENLCLNCKLIYLEARK